MAKYPGAIPSLAEIFTAIDYVDWTKAEKWNNLRAELRAALVELGTDPAETFATVKARLDALALKTNVLGLDNVAPFTPDADYEPATKKYVDDIEVAGFTDRGDPADWDFKMGDLTIDGAWHELDLSAIVPAEAKAVLINGRIRNAVVQKPFGLVRNGYTNRMSRALYYTQVANLYLFYSTVVGCDADRKIQYRAENVVWTAIDFVVVGWWK